MRNPRIVWLLIAAVLTATVGCSSSTRTVRVAVPPRVNLHAYPAVGLVAFSSSTGDAELERFSTQRFIQALQEAQPGTRVVELGRETDVLAGVKGNAWDAATLRAVKETNHVDVIVIGRLDLTKNKPNVSFSSGGSLWQALDVRQDVKACLTARLYETATAATMWTDSAQLTTSVANASVSNNAGRAGGGFGMRDAQGAYAQMIDRLVCDVTDAFRTHYVTRRVPKDQVETASAAD
jgi:hypothetical protein